MFKHSLRSCIYGTILLGSAASALAAPSPAEVFNSYVIAANAGDMEAIRELIAADVERSDFVGCSPEMDNPSCLLGYIEATVVTPKGHISVLNTQVAGDVVTATLELRSALAKRVGVERILGKDIVRISDGQIKAFHFRLHTRFRG